MCSGRTACAGAWVMMVSMRRGLRVIVIFLGGLGVGLLGLDECFEDRVAERDPALGGDLLQLSDLVTEFSAGGLQFLESHGVSAARDATFLAFGERDDQSIDLGRYGPDRDSEVGVLFIRCGAQGILIERG